MTGREATGGEQTDEPVGEALVRAYYAALDGHEYDRLASLLAPDFRQDRPDMTLDGRAEFVEFMREKRPQTSTSHPIEAVYRAGERSLAVKGRLVGQDGREITGFVDVFTVVDGRIAAVETYTDR
ncbi:MAG: nuclear transport factor 2 family protein [Natrialbaceae archaeon]